MPSGSFIERYFELDFLKNKGWSFCYFNTYIMNYRNWSVSVHVPANGCKSQDEWTILNVVCTGVPVLCFLVMPKNHIHSVYTLNILNKFVR